MKQKLSNIASNNGKFTDGNPTTGQLGTRVTAAWLNDVQDRHQDFYSELANVLALAGYQPDPTKVNQVAEAIKAYLQSYVNSLTRNIEQRIPNSKKSNAVDSNSADTVATSAAVKTAYDQGSEALNVANAKWTQQRASDIVEGTTVLSHEINGVDKTKAASEYALGEVAKRKADAKHTHKANEITDFDENTNNLIKQSFAGNLALTGWSRLPNGLIQQWSEVAIKDIINDTNRDMSTGNGNLFKWVFPISFPKFCGALTLIELGHPNHQDWNAHIQRVRIHTLTNSYALIKLTEWQQANQDGLKIKLSAIGV